MQTFLVLFLCGLSCVYAKEYTPVKQYNPPLSMPAATKLAKCLEKTKNFRDVFREENICKSGSEKLFKNVAIITKRGVCTRLPCQMKLGEEVVAEIEFTNKERVEKIVSTCKALVLGNEIDFDIPNAEKGCDQLIKGKCPAEPNSDLELKLTVPVKPPSLAKVGIDTKLEINLKDQKNKVISCFTFTAKVNI